MTSLIYIDDSMTSAGLKSLFSLSSSGDGKKCASHGHGTQIFGMNNP